MFRSIILGISFTLIAAPAVAQIAGTARVVDGDTLEVGGERVRLHGIDAPETGQFCDLGGEPWDCGAAAAETLRTIIDGNHVICTGNGSVRDGLPIVRCKVDWLDLGAEMVTRGFAVAYLKYSTDYIRNYREARGKGNGIFAGEFIEPDKWRQGKRHPIERRINGGVAPD